MEVLINRTGREDYIDYSCIIKSLNDHNFAYRDCEVQDKRYEICDIEYYCTNCGCKLRGVWKHQHLLLAHRKPCYICQSKQDCQRIENTINQINNELNSPDKISKKDKE